MFEKKRKKGNEKLRKTALMKTLQIAVKALLEKSLQNMVIFQVPGMLSTRQDCSKAHPACLFKVGDGAPTSSLGNISVPHHPHSTELLPNI